MPDSPNRVAEPTIAEPKIEISLDEEAAVLPGERQEQVAQIVDTVPVEPVSADAQIAIDALQTRQGRIAKQLLQGRLAVMPAQSTVDPDGMLRLAEEWPQVHAAVFGQRRGVAREAKAHPR